MHLLRRRLLAAGLLAPAWLPGTTAAQASTTPARHAVSPRPLEFPRDHGSHPASRTEWWYITGHAQGGERAFGFQLTFFRSRVDEAQGLRSAFAARQLIFAHAAVTDLQQGRLLHDQRIARAGFGIAQASETDTQLKLRDWSLLREVEGGRERYVAHLPADGFGIELQFEPTQPLIAQGQAGFSRKGPQPEQSSYYYSLPQLRASGRLRVGAQNLQVQGRAWLDHEWSEALLHADAIGWDWIGMNLDDGAALTAFRLRRADGTGLWFGGSWRDAQGRLRIFGHEELYFEALQRWTSPRTQVSYPVRWRIHTPAGRFEVRALLDDQELDSRASTGTLYWEGLTELLDESGQRVGRGYLELTGYAQRLAVN